MNVVDSSAWLAYFAGESNAGFFAPAIEDAEMLIVPVVCVYEVFKVVLRESGEDDALQAIQAMRAGAIVDLDADLSLEAAAISLDEDLPFADSVVYAVALQRAAKVWTQDKHFRGKPNVRYRPKLNER